MKRTWPDRTFRTLWRNRPDDVALNDPALELVLPEAAELAEIPARLPAPGVLPELGINDEITVQSVIDCFDGTKVFKLDKGGFMEPIPPGPLIPTATLRAPPAIISATAILPENLAAAWKDGATNGLAIATALSQQEGRTLLLQFS